MLIWPAAVWASHGAARVDKKIVLLLTLAWSMGCRCFVVAGPDPVAAEMNLIMALLFWSMLCCSPAALVICFCCCCWKLGANVDEEEGNMAKPHNSWVLFYCCSGILYAGSRILDTSAMIHYLLHWKIEFSLPISLDASVLLCLSRNIWISFAKIGFSSFKAGLSTCFSPSP